jgi:hypothetical protein
MATRNFPRRALEQALRVPRALKDKNGGNPWPPDQVASALGIGAMGGNFFYLSGSSRDYGLTEGSRDTVKISLTELGRKAVYPQSDAEENQALLSAFLSVEVFKRVLEHFRGNNLPERKFLENTLHQTFGVDPQFHDEFVALFDKNCRFLGIGNEFAPGATAAGVAKSVTTGAPTDGASVTVATPSGDENAPICFVIMPFSERDDRHETGFFAEVLEHVFTPAATDAGFRVATAQRQGSDIIQSTIVNDLLAADLVLADLTEHNPNVLFELGMRMHEDKPVALVRAKGTGPIFDVDNMLRVEEYNPNLWRSTVEGDVPRLRDHIQATWDNREIGPTFMRLLRPAST